MKRAQRTTWGIWYISLVPILLSQLVNIGALILIGVFIVIAARENRKVRTQRISKQKINFVQLFIVLLTVFRLFWLIFFFVPKEQVQEQGFIIAYVIITHPNPTLSALPSSARQRCSRCVS